MAILPWLVKLSRTFSRGVTEAGAASESALDVEAVSECLHVLEPCLMMKRVSRRVPATSGGTPWLAVLKVWVKGLDSCAQTGGCIRCCTGRFSKGSGVLPLTRFVGRGMCF